MTAMAVSYWERRDSADRRTLGQVAFDLCKAQRAAGMIDSRFYWLDPDTIVLQTTADSSAELYGDQGDDVLRSLFALGDVARQSRFEVWMDPRTGMTNYERAGR